MWIYFKKRNEGGNGGLGEGLTAGEEEREGEKEPRKAQTFASRQS